HPPDQRQGSAATYVAFSVVSTTVIKKRFRLTIVRRSASHAVLDALRPLFGAARHTAVLRGQLDVLSTQGTFSPLGDLL
ncbi:hypothetical protein ALQ52_01817, partial [Pseudomonas cannabina pv. alisalensis]